MKYHNEIQQSIAQFFVPKSPVLSKRFPKLLPLILWVRYTKRKIENYFLPLARTKKVEKYPSIIARHQSVLRRTLGTSDMRLQEQKVTNLRVACEKLDGLVIYPNEIFSLWDIIGKPSYENGFVDGMLLSNGKVIEGAGGGLCQLSNFLTWIFLHTDIEIIERHHHSRDVFPDSGRVIPFGSGATIFYNLLDLKVKNISKYPMQIDIFITEKYLKGRIVSTQPSEKKFHIHEKESVFVRSHKKEEAFQVFRYNQIWRETRIKGATQEEEKIFTNFAPVEYALSKDIHVHVI